MPHKGATMKAFCVKQDNAALILGGVKRVESRKYRVRAGYYALICVHNKMNPYAAREYEARDPGGKLRKTLPVPDANILFAVVYLEEGVPYDDFVKQTPREAKWALRGTAEGCPRIWNKGGNFVNLITEVRAPTAAPMVLKGRMGVFQLGSEEASRVHRAFGLQGGEPAPSHGKRKASLGAAAGRKVAKKPAQHS